MVILAACKSTSSPGWLQKGARHGHPGQRGGGAAAAGQFGYRKEPAMVTRGSKTNGIGGMRPVEQRNAAATIKNARSMF